MGVGDRVFEAKWSVLGERKQVGNCNREVRMVMGKAGVSYPETEEDDFNPSFRLL